jgi:hypothetical protein
MKLSFRDTRPAGEGNTRSCGPPSRDANCSAAIPAAMTVRCTTRFRPDFVLPGAAMSGALDPHDAACKVKVASTETEDLALPQTCERRENDQAMLRAVARESLDLRPQEETRFALFVPWRTDTEDRRVDAMSSLLRTPEDLLQQLQCDRGRRGARRPTAAM